MLALHSSQAVFFGWALVCVAAICLIDLCSDSLRVPFLHTEWLCWLILAALAKVTQSSSRFLQHDDRTCADKLALAIAALALCWTFGDARWAVPLTTPACLLIVALESQTPKLPVDAPEKPNGFHKSSALDTSLPIKGIAVAAIIAIISAVLLFPFPPTSVDAGTGLGVLAASMFIFFTIHQRRPDNSMGEDSSTALFSIPALSTACRVFAVLSLVTMVPSNQRTNIDVPLIVFTAFLKAIQWISILELISRGFLLPTSTIVTFANSLLQITALPIHGVKIELVAGVALVSLVQTYRFIHKFALSRPILIAAAALLFLTLIGRRSDQVHYRWNSFNSFGEQLHPIEILVKEAKEEFASMIASQSKTVDQAVQEYQRRYNRVPPPGFDEWAKLALEADCPIIDNFDTVMQTLDPFWGLSAQEFRARSTMLDKSPLAVVSVFNHTVEFLKDSLVLGGFNSIILEWTTRHKDSLPDMEFVINGLAEPRVITANDRIHHLVTTCAPIPEGEINGTRKELEVMDLGKESSWQIGTRSCPEDSPSRSILIPEEKPGLRFVKNATSAKDWCQHPEAAHSHGLFSSPYNLKITDTLVPVFSHGKPSTSQDILYPSPDYLVGYREGKYNDTADSDWDSKSNQLYWSGSDTGGYAIGQNWRNFHRQRFVDMVTNNEQEVELLSRDKSGKWNSFTQPLGNLTDLANVKFSAIEACAGFTCKEEEKYLPVGERDDPTVAYNYRFLFDVDGMGRTERYYRLLGSRATILKQTMHQEWHDDRLVPWVHYVPVSLDMDELPEMLRFLVTTESGQAISREIADSGREWQQKALRDKDMDLAFFRILLEYGRLLSPNRDLEGYCPDGRAREG